MSNIEQILSKCDNCKLNECDGCITYSDMQVIKARIKELEEKNRMLALEGSRVRLDLYIKQNYIPKQKVKDKIEEVKLSGGGNGKDNVENLARELVIDVLEELLEEGDKYE